MYLDHLNKNQLEAVKKTDGPIRIIAGPGSGKTRTIISKIAYILENNLAYPNQILAITFTNKAANEIKERLSNLLNDTFDSPYVFTYHGFSAHFLRREAQRIGIDPNYRIIDALDSKNLIKESFNELNDNKDTELTIDIKEAEQGMNKFFALGKGNFSDDVDPEYKKDITALHEKYVLKKEGGNLFDFDDLLIKVEEAITAHKEISNIWKNKYKYIFVDEFQDINITQFNILKGITSPDSNLTVVGDPDQNIYSWRGANIKIILDFDKHYKNTKTIILNKNYRSNPKILELANKLISNNKNRVNFDLTPVKKTSVAPIIFYGYSKFDEAEKVVNEIIKLNKLYSVKYHEIAIIYRSNYISREFETTLMRNGIKYALIGGFKFFERKEVKEALNFFHFVLNKDNFSLLRIINVPTKGIGEKTITKFIKESEEANLTIWEFLVETFDSIKNEKLKEFIEVTRKFIELMEKSDDPILVLEKFLKEINFLGYYEKIEDRLKNIEGLLEQLKHKFSKKKNFKESISIFFQNIALVSSSDSSTRKNSITLITGHASKGTEFNTVFCVGLNKNVIPSSRAEISGEFEEERRILYVSMTRAMERLYFSYSLGTTYYGKSEEPSKFIYELEFSKENTSSSKNDEISINDKIFHKLFGKGVVLQVTENVLVVAFNKETGIKELILGHPSYSKI